MTAFRIHMLWIDHAELGEVAGAAEPSAVNLPPALSSSVQVHNHSTEMLGIQADWSAPRP